MHASWEVQVRTVPRVLIEDSAQLVQGFAPLLHVKCVVDDPDAQLAGLVLSRAEDPNAPSGRPARLDVRGVSSVTEAPLGVGKRVREPQRAELAHPVAVGLLVGEPKQLSRLVTHIPM